ncbi:hypothetical protein [Sphingobacterium griseoflavum]|uniref:Uncharacterized protein n=1 Tax=Sphingobacterium griseoflavum TaxID=1474952 RepID=A0ABQ3HUH7_9SPHI|nr:hypothetical protein [Sphingobacterium griseoflavum]GHE34987.1 hypothetical protein GCM10017764_17720 [Sphingobacterium griseoflavum]
MEKFNYTQPEYLFCDIAVKDGSYNDNRMWVYHRPSLSLIEFVCLNDVDSLEFTGYSKDYVYLDDEPEAWKGVFVQNNCEVTSNDPIVVIDRAWAYLENYLKWEDSQHG